MRSAAPPRPGRGRPNKVTKPGTQQLQQQQRSANLRQHAQLLEAAAEPPKSEHDFDDDDDDVDIEAEADDDGDDDARVAAALGPSSGAATTTASGTSHVQNIDLNTAASLLANGGVGIVDPHGTTAADLMSAAAAGGPDHPSSMLSSSPPGLQGHAGPSSQVQTTSNLDPSLVKTTEVVAHESGYGGFIIESALAKRLAHNPGLRAAHQRRPEQQLNLARRSNVEALFAHIAGDLAPAPCKNCHKGHGPWNCCVVLDGQMCGSCANCWFNASGARCSFHDTRQAGTQPLHSHHPALLASASNASLASADGSSSAAAAAAAAASFNLSQSLSLAPPPSSSLGSSTTAPPAAMTQPAAAPGMFFTADVLVRHSLDRAVAEVRAADRTARAHMAVELQVRQLALQIVAYEEAVVARDAAEGQQQQQQQQQLQHHQQQQQPSVGSHGAAATGSGVSGVDGGSGADASGSGALGEDQSPA